MKYDISEELLSEVLGKDCQICGITDNNELKYTAYSDQFNERYYINVYELAYKNLKQWAKIKNVFDRIEWSEEPEQIFKKAEEIRNEHR